MTTHPIQPAPVVKLTPTQEFWLREIASPSADTNPFPPQGTLRALLRRGLIKEHRDERDIMCRLLGLVKIKITTKGRSLLAQTEGAR